MKEKLIIENISTPMCATLTKSSDETLLRLINEVKDIYPTLENNKIILPTIIEKNYIISLYGSSNTAVIDESGNVYQPLEDMTVNLFYKITNLSTNESLEMDNPIVVKVKGFYDASNINRPKTVPEIREWCGSDKFCKVTGNIIYKKSILKETAEQVALYIEKFARIKTSLKNDCENSGDIILLLDKTLPVGEEGYTINIDENVKVSATNEKGLVYAGATIAQMLMQSKDRYSLACGQMRDYPQYGYRSFMIDTARYFMSLDYLEEITKYAAFFKINYVHLHLNDGGGEVGTCFRIKSDKYPALNEGIINTCETGEEKLWSKRDFIEYQKRISKLGVEIVPEIDSPSHCGAIGNASKSKEAIEGGYNDISLNHWQIDLRNEKLNASVDFVSSVFEEFLDNDNPVFLGKKVHVGTDEWVRNADEKNFTVTEYGLTESERNELMRTYMDKMIKFINSKGYEPMLWNGLNEEGKTYGGKTPVSNDAIFQTWALNFGNINIALDEERKITNNYHFDLYIVPGGSYYKNDLDIKDMFDNWCAEKFGKIATLAEGHPLLLGAETAFWLDIGCGMSNIDVFKLLKKQIMIICEKTWHGRKTGNQTSDDFIYRVETLANYAPNANPGRYTICDKNGIISKYNFSNTKSDVIKDISDNGNDAKVFGLRIDDNGFLKFDKKGYISLPFNTVGDTYTLQMKLLISNKIDKNAVLLSSDDGRLVLNFDGSGKMSYDRKGYTFLFDCVLPSDIWIDLSVNCRNNNCQLTVDGKTYDSIFVKTEYEIVPKPEKIFYTFQLPTQRIGEGFIGYISDFSIEK